MNPSNTAKRPKMRKEYDFTQARKNPYAAQLKKQITKLKSAMLKASKEMDFMQAARLRDEMFGLEKLLEDK